MRGSWAATAARVSAQIASGHEIWQALTGQPMPLSGEEIRVAAVRYGMPADVVQRGAFTLADVTHFMAGKRLAALDDRLDRVYTAAAEAAARQAATCAPGTPSHANTCTEMVDDEYAAIARRLSGTTRAAMVLLLEMHALSRGDKLARQFIADELGVDYDSLRVVRTELSKTGKVLVESIGGCRGGWWLSPDGVRVAQLLAARRPGGVPAASLAKPA